MLVLVLYLCKIINKKELLRYNLGKDFQIIELYQDIINIQRKNIIDERNGGRNHG